MLALTASIPIADRVVVVPPSEEKSSWRGCPENIRPACGSVRLRFPWLKVMYGDKLKVLHMPNGRSRSPAGPYRLAPPKQMQLLFDRSGSRKAEKGNDRNLMVG